MDKPFSGRSTGNASGDSILVRPIHVGSCLFASFLGRSVAETPFRTWIQADSLHCVLIVDITSGVMLGQASCCFCWEVMHEQDDVSKVKVYEKISDRNFVLTLSGQSNLSRTLNVMPDEARRDRNSPVALKPCLQLLFYHASIHTDHCTSLVLFLELHQQHSLY